MEHIWRLIENERKVQRFAASEAHYTPDYRVREAGGAELVEDHWERLSRRVGPRKLGLRHIRHGFASPPNLISAADAQQREGGYCYFERLPLDGKMALRRGRTHMR